jgi:methylthioribulose-1-phosphate dehydratase
MLKGFGVWEENPQVEMPVFANHLQVPQIASDIYERFQVVPPSLNALLIRNHGVTVWASSPEGARNYLEIAEYMFRYMVAARKVGIEEPLGKTH